MRVDLRLGDVDCTVTEDTKGNYRISISEELPELLDALANLVAGRKLPGPRLLRESGGCAQPVMECWLRRDGPDTPFSRLMKLDSRV